MTAFAVTSTVADAGTGLTAGDWVIYNRGPSAIAWAQADNAPASINDFFACPVNGAFNFCEDNNPLTLWVQTLTGTATLVRARPYSAEAIENLRASRPRAIGESLARRPGPPPIHHAGGGSTYSSSSSGHNSSATAQMVCSKSSA